LVAELLAAVTEREPGTGIFHPAAPAAALLLPARAAVGGARHIGNMSAAALASVVLGEVGLVCAGAAAGATVRYAAHEAYVRLHARLVAAPAAAAASEALGLRGAAPHPPLWGVVGVNIAASFVLGALASEDAARRRNLLIGTGFCGGMSSKWRLLAVAGLGQRTLALALTSPRDSVLHICRRVCQADGQQPAARRGLLGRLQRGLHRGCGHCVPRQVSALWPRRGSGSGACEQVDA
jgi:fluoride ion exporter CrcB/FEX